MLKGGEREMYLETAIVEDNHEAAEVLEQMLGRYAAEKKLEIRIRKYESACAFLQNYCKETDLVFMDISMPCMDGMEAAQKLRELDTSVVLVFITNMAQYATKGYEVDAQNFLIKPLRYSDLRFSMDKAVVNIRRHKRGEGKLSLITDHGAIVLRASEILYVEILKHRLYYYTERGCFDIYGSLRETEEALAPFGFLRCNACYLVNLHYVRWVRRYELVLWNGTEEIVLAISRNKYKNVLEAFTRFLREDL